MSSGWSRNVKTAAAAYVAYKALGGARHVLYTGYVSRILFFYELIILI
jgi:hypothetical protein